MKRNILNSLKICLYKILAPFRDRWQPVLIESILEKNFKRNDVFVFIQVGAHDGVSHDSLYDFVKFRRPKGVVIEPLADLYKQLVSTYTSFDEILTVNKAIHPTEKRITLYRVDPEKLHGLPGWSSGIASLDPEHHKKSGTPSSVIISQEVEADTLMNIMNHYLCGEIDLLQIDVEGFDYEVLKQVNFGEIYPSIIKFEYVNLSNEDRIAALQLLRSKRYWCFYQGLDIIAVRLSKIYL